MGIEPRGSIAVLRMAGIGASASLLDAPAKVASPKNSGRSALAAGPSLHAPEPTFKAAPADRRADGRTDIRTRILQMLIGCFLAGTASAVRALRRSFTGCRLVHRR
jgi:hypothetical protein